MGGEARRPVELFWACAVGGWAVIAFGVWGVISQANRTHPSDLAVWFVGGLLAHDLVAAPLVCLAGRALRRVARGRARTWLQCVMVSSALLALASVPVLGGFGRDPRNPSVLPNDYAASLAIVLAVVWAVMTVAALRPRRRRAERRGRA